MRPLVDVQCPACGHFSRREYRRLGSSGECAGCQVNVVAVVRQGTSYPATGWELTFDDFLRLVRDPESRERVEPLLHAWFGYRLHGSGPETEISDSSGQVLDALAVHLAIQDDPGQQLSLYQLAMSLWR